MEAAKKGYFFSGQSTKAFSPSPRLSDKKNGYQFKKKYHIIKSSFFLSGQPLTPSPLLVDCQLKKKLFFTASLTYRQTSGQSDSQRSSGPIKHSTILIHI